jgi:hypothetical protein
VQGVFLFAASAHSFNSKTQSMSMSVIRKQPTVEPAVAERIRVFLRARPLTADEVRGKVSIEEWVLELVGVLCVRFFFLFRLSSLVVSPSVYLNSGMLHVVVDTIQ